MRRLYGVVSKYAAVFDCYLTITDCGSGFDHGIHVMLTTDVVHASVLPFCVSFAGLLELRGLV